jgi:ferredoxin
MAYVIAEPCTGVKDTACVDVCPVNCIHPRKDEPAFAGAAHLHIDGENCICCGACVPVVQFPRFTLRKSCQKNGSSTGR